MSAHKRVLIIGLDPFLLDFSASEFQAIPGLTAEKVMAGTHASIAALEAAGYEAGYCFTDTGATAAEQVRQQLSAQHYEVIVFGAGLRVPPSRLLLFEELLNVVHELAPSARICFNTNPTDTLEAVRRWLL